jgi:hypothetical protein
MKKIGFLSFGHWTPRVRRARLSGPEHVTKDAPVAEIAADGNMTVLVQGTNEWVCTPGNENKIGDPPMWIGHLKDNAGTGSLYRSQHEFILVFKQGKGSHRNNVQLGQLGRYRTKANRDAYRDLETPVKRN